MRSIQSHTPTGRTVPQPMGHGVYARPHRSRRTRSAYLLSALGVLCLALGITRVAGAFGMGGGSDDVTLTVAVERQQTISLDLASARPRSPYVFGVNVFPADGTQSQDGAYGFMAYDRRTTTAIRTAHITMLRFPGGSWGEQHSLSSAQLNAFLRLAHRTGAQPLMQVRLTNDNPEQAAALVDYCNNRRDPIRSQYPNLPFEPVRYWVIGNEPDLLGGITVDRYTRRFIAFAQAMKAADPSIRIYGPEISQYTGGDMPRDSSGVPWLQGFLTRVAAYERVHHVRLLDGVSIHRYPFGVGAVGSTGLLFSAADEWEYALPLLRSQIHQIMGTDLPVAITELNTGSLGGATLSPLATAIWWSTTLGILLEQHVQLVDFFAFRGLEHPYSLLTTAGGLSPSYRAMQLYSHMAPDVLQAGSAGDPVSVFASTDSARDTATLMFVNKTPAAAGVEIGGADRVGGNGTIGVRIPAYAMACLVLRQSGDNRLYLYAPAASVLAAGRAGPITMRLVS